jgi:diacylglycerol kinase family enzyme
MILPAGRGDDFFKAVSGKRFLGSEAAWDCALKLFREGSPKPADVGTLRWTDSLVRTDVRYFMNIASFGFPGLVVQRVLTHAGFFGKSRAGKTALTYLLQSAASMVEYKPMEVVVKLDGEPFYAGPIQSGFVMNGCYNGGGIRWSNESQIDDGLFHLLVMEPQGLMASLTGGGRMLSGDWKGAGGVHQGSGHRIEVSLKPGASKLHPLFEVDGDQNEEVDTRGAVLEMLPGAIQLWR